MLERPGRTGGLSFVERPAWCYHSACKSPDGQAVPLSGIPFLPTFVSSSIELACCAALLVELALLFCYRGSADFWRSSWGPVCVAIVLVGTADCVFDNMTAHAADLTPSRTWRLAPILRPIICTVRSNSLRKRMLLMSEVLWDIKDMLLLVAFFVFWFGVVMFAFFKKFCQPPDCDESAYYGTLPRALLSTFTILTTANFPDV